MVRGPSPEEQRGAGGEPEAPPGLSSQRPDADLSRRPFDVFMALLRAELRTRREFTVTGAVKWMVEPLSYMVIYFVLVASVLRSGQGPAYPLFLLCALVPFQFFNGSVSGAMALLNRFSNVLTDMPTPKAVLPLVLIASEAANLLVALVLFVPMVLIYRVDVWPSLLWLPVVLLTLVLLTAGPTYLATVFGLYFPDFRGVAQNGLRAAFLVSTALVALKNVPGDRLPDLVRANPLSGVFETFRVAFGVSPNDSPPTFDLVYPVLVGVVLLIIGVVVFRWRERHFPKEV